MLRRLRCLLQQMLFTHCRYKKYFSYFFSITTLTISLYFVCQNLALALLSIFKFFPVNFAILLTVFFAFRKKYHKYMRYLLCFLNLTQLLMQNSHSLLLSSIHLYSGKHWRWQYRASAADIFLFFRLLQLAGILKPKDSYFHFRWQGFFFCLYNFGSTKCQCPFCSLPFDT